jgi:prepilin-type N-terminal cleavage/methylation domain-containing protein
MKLPYFRSSSRAGFTLVELLVVMGIIAILASVVSVAASSAINAAKRVKAAAFAGQIQAAVINYDTEYGVYPVDPAAAAGQDTLYNAGAEWGPMTVALNGGVDPGNPPGGQIPNAIPNSRQIAFLSFNKSDLDTTLHPAVPKTPFKDAKGNIQYFSMAMDTDYSGIIGDSGGAAPPDFAGLTSTSAPVALPTKMISGGVVVWANCDPNTGATTNPKFWVHTF